MQESLTTTSQLTDKINSAVTSLATSDSLTDDNILRKVMDVNCKVVESVTMLQNKIGESLNPIIARLDSLRSFVADSLVTVIPDAKTGIKGDVKIKSRENNVILFGIPKSRQRSEWNQLVADALDLTAGRKVEIVDAYGLGKYQSDKCKPILAKLQSTWDKRLVLSNSYRLRNSDNMKKVFLGADEPVEVRKKKIIASMKQRAERDGLQTEEVDVGLLVDGCLVYSVTHSKVSSTVPQNDS